MFSTELLITSICTFHSLYILYFVTLVELARAPLIVRLVGHLVNKVVFLQTLFGSRLCRLGDHLGNHIESSHNCESSKLGS